MAALPLSASGSDPDGPRVGGGSIPQGALQKPLPTERPRDWASAPTKILTEPAAGCRPSGVLYDAAAQR